MMSDPAFPSHGSMGEVCHEGMTLRDYFAAAALPAFISLDGTPCEEPDELWDGATAARAYAMADAMLKARSV